MEKNMYGFQNEHFLKQSSWEVMFGRVTQGKARDFLTNYLQQSFEHLVVRFPTDVRGCRLRPQNDGNIYMLLDVLLCIFVNIFTSCAVLWRARRATQNTNNE